MDLVLYLLFIVQLIDSPSGGYPDIYIPRTGWRAHQDNICTASREYHAGTYMQAEDCMHAKAHIMDMPDVLDAQCRIVHVTLR